MDLATLGKVLKERREAIGMARTELAARIDRTPTYVYLIEETRSARGRRPTRPRSSVLLTWAEQLGMEKRYAHQLLLLAGYDPSDPDRTRTPSQRLSSEDAELASRIVSSPVRFPEPIRLESKVLLDQMEGLLTSSSRHGRQVEVTNLLRTLLDFVAADDRSSAQLLPLFSQDGMRCYTPTDRLRQAIEEMDLCGFSQVVVRLGRRLALLTDAGVIRWFLETSAFDAPQKAADATIQDVLAWEPNGTLAILSGQQTIRDAILMFRGSVEASHPLQAIVITARGKSDVKPLGIITPWDLVTEAVPDR